MPGQWCRPSTVLAVFACLTACSLGASAAIYEHQAGLFDWHQSFVGAARQVVSGAEGTDVIFVATDDGALAALSAANGKLLWRQELRRGDSVDLITSSGAGVVAVTAGHTRLSKRDAETGTLVWEEVLAADGPYDIPASQSAPALRASSAADDWETAEGAGQDSSSSHIVVLKDNTVQLRTVRAGAAVWSTALANHATVFRLVAATDESVVALGSNSAGAVVLTTLSKAAGTVAKSTTLEVAGRCAFVGGVDPTHAACTSDKVLVVFDLHGDHILRRVALDKAVSRISTTFAGKHAAVALTFTDGSTSLYDASGKVVKSSAGVCAATGNLCVEDVDLSRIPAHHGTAAALFPGAVSAAPVVFVRTSDDALHAVSKGGKIQWSRNEHLAHIADSLMVDLPADDVVGSNTFSGNVVSMALARVQMSIADALFYIQHPAALLGFGGTDADGDLARDFFNLRRLVIAVSDTGKLTALGSDSGAVVWQLLPPLSGTIANAKLLLLSGGNTPYPLAAAIFTTSEGHQVFQFNPVTGAAAPGTGVLRLDVAAYGPVRLHEHSPGDAVVFVDTSMRVHVVPDVPDALEAISSRTSALHLHNVDVHTGVVAGYSVVAGGVDETLIAERLWTIKFHPSTETIAAVAPRLPHARVSGLGDPLGDGTVLYKYLNPNLQAIATLSPYEKRAATLTVYLVDVVKGRVVDTMFQEGARGPVHLAQSENWVVCHFKNRKAKRYEVAVMQMYEADAKAVEKPFSSFDTSNPIILRQSFIAYTGVAAMTTTVSRQGIARKQVVFGQTNGLILGVSKDDLDVRRPKNKQEAEIATGLKPYSPLMAVEFPNYIGYNQTVRHLRNIRIEPSGLESTSLVFAYGLDLFYTQVSPGKKFDVLAEGFDFVLLSLALIAMGVGCKLAANAAGKKVLAQKWK